MSSGNNASGSPQRMNDWRKVMTARLRKRERRNSAAQRLFSPRSQVALGNASCGRSSCFAVAGEEAKQSFADKHVPKCNLGTRRKKTKEPAGVLSSCGYSSFFFSLMASGCCAEYSL